MSRTGDGIVVRTRRLWKSGFSRERILRSFARSPALWHETPAFDLIAPGKAPVFKALLVVAHPDDESECAGLVYRITHELGGAVDQVVVTNGEAGCQYAAPAQAYYGLPLTHQAAGRKHLRKSAVKKCCGRAGSWAFGAIIFSSRRTRALRWIRRRVCGSGTSHASGRSCWDCCSARIMTWS